MNQEDRFSIIFIYICLFFYRSPYIYIYYIYLLYIYYYLFYSDCEMSKIHGWRQWWQLREAGWRWMELLNLDQDFGPSQHACVLRPSAHIIEYSPNSLIRCTLKGIKMTEVFPFVQNCMTVSAHLTLNAASSHGWTPLASHESMTSCRITSCFRFSTRMSSSCSTFIESEETLFQISFCAQ